MKEFIDKLNCEIEEKVKVTRLEIIVTGTKDKPYFEIKYKELGKEDYNIGYSSYDLNNVFAWKEECFEIVNQLAEEYKGGWIPCSERLPEDDTKRYIVQEKGGFINILGFTKDAFKQSKFDFYEYKGKKKALFYAWDSEYGYIERECVAWCELPVPYTEGE